MAQPDRRTMPDLRSSRTCPRGRDLCSGAEECPLLPARPAVEPQFLRLWESIPVLDTAPPSSLSSLAPSRRQHTLAQIAQELQRHSAAPAATSTGLSRADVTWTQRTCRIT